MITHTANPVPVTARVIIAVQAADYGNKRQLLLEGGSTVVVTQEMIARYEPAPGDYFVTQEDGYEYINPKAVFERKYSAKLVEEPKLVFSESRNFGDFVFALRWLKAGRALTRAGWNGKGMFAYMVPANSYPAQTDVAKAYFGEGALVPYSAYFALKGVDGTVSTWVPSMNDVLAEDWMLVESPTTAKE